MAITIGRNDLESTIVRNGVLSSLGGERTIDVSTAIVEQGEDVGFIQGITNSLVAFFSGIIGNRATSLLCKGGGWILGSIGAFTNLSFSALWSWGQESIIRLWNFDWNATDKELLDQNKQSQAAIFASWGTAFGSAVGWTASVGLGYGIGLAVPVIGSKLLAASIANAVRQEGVEEFTATVKGAINVTFRTLSENAVRSSYVAGRKFIRDAQIAYAQQYFGDDAAKEILEQQNAATSWGGDAAPNWSFSSQLEKNIQKLSPNWRIFASAFFDESGDAMFEAGYIIANELDKAAANREAAKLENPERGLVLYPDRNSPDERAIIYGRQEEIVPQVQSYLNNYRTIRQKDVGELVGMPAYEIVTPQTSERTLTIEYLSYERPPFNRLGVQAKRSRFTISDAKAGITFNQMKLAFRPFQYGGQRIGCKLDNGRQLAVYAVSDAEGEQMMDILLQFTNANSTSYVFTDVNKGVAPARRREPEIRYPYKATMRRVRGDINLGTQTITNESMLLWRDEPVDIDVFS